MRFRQTSKGVTPRIFRLKMQIVVCEVSCGCWSRIDQTLAKHREKTRWRSLFLIFVELSFAGFAPCCMCIYMTSLNVSFPVDVKSFVATEGCSLQYRRLAVVRPTGRPTVTRMSHGCHTGVTRIIWGCRHKCRHNSMSRVDWRSAWLLRRWLHTPSVQHLSITRVSHSCHTGVTQVSHGHDLRLPLRLLASYLCSVYALHMVI